MIEALRYEKPFPFDAILVPPLRLRAHALYFDPRGPLQPSKGQIERLVFDFARLANAPESAFLEFAQVWGALGLCSHRRSIHHEAPPCLPRLIRGEFAESIKSWRHLAQYVRSILTIKEALHRDHSGETADWKIIWPGPPPAENDAAGSLAVATSIFLSGANVQPIVGWVGNRFTITFIGGNLLGVLDTMGKVSELGSWLGTAGILYAQIAMRTALVVQEGAGWIHCSNPECGRLYRSPRHPAQGRSHFCQSCGKRAAWRLSKRRSALRRSLSQTRVRS